MTMTPKKLFRHLHLWLSVPFGLVVTVVCLTGAMLVFEDEVTRAVHPGLYYVEPGGEPLDAGTLVAAVTASLPEGAEVKSITTYADPSRAWRVALTQPRRAAVMVNQYTGEVLGRTERLPVFTVAFRLHRWLMDSPAGHGSMSVGKLVVGISTLAFILALVTGVVVWWPRSRRALKAGLKIPLRRGAFALWRGTHVAGGMYALILLLLMAVTGLTWSFGWWRTAVYAVAGVGTSPSGGHTQPSVQSGGNAGRERDGGRADATAGHDVWQRALDEVASRVPSASSMTVSDGEVRVPCGTMGNVRAGDTYHFDKMTGALTGVELYDGQPAQSRARGWLYSLHTGAWGGMAGRILSFAAALVGASLPLTGYWIWLRRISRKKKNGV